MSGNTGREWGMLPSAMQDYDEEHDGRHEIFESEAVTRGIRVRVQSMVDAHRSDPSQNQWFFLYTVTVSNESDSAVQLLSRHWIVRDERGGEEEVRGPGVVGEQPVILPGAFFEYTSGCPLQAPTGTMEGTYRMVDAEGESFDVEIAPFVLSEPYVAH